MTTVSRRIKLQFILAVTVASGACLAAHAGGGTVNFANNSSTKAINAQTGDPILVSDGVRAALYWAPQGSNSFVQIGAPVTVGVPLPGLFAGGSRTNGVATPAGAAAQFQVRAWEGGFATYEAALASGAILSGQSPIVSVVTGNPEGAPPTPPASLPAIGVTVSAGGTVNFANNSSTMVINGQTGNPVAAADGFRAALFWARLGSSDFLQIGAPVTVGVPLPGLFAGGTRMTGGATPAGSTARFQVRVWGGGFSTYEEALLHGGVALGQSAILDVMTGDPGGAAPTPPGSLIASAPANEPLLVTWGHHDVNWVGASGSANCTNGAFTLRGSGDEIGGTADAFFYLHQMLTGDGQIIARLVALGNADPLAEAGVMIRDGLFPDARHAFLAVNHSQVLEFRRRVLINDYSYENKFAFRAKVIPAWLRLMRMGNTFVGLYSNNGVNWELVWFTTIDMPRQVEIGLAVTAHHYGQLNTAIFDNVSVSGLTPLSGDWSGPPRLYLGGEQLGLVGPDISSGFKMLVGGATNQVYAVQGSTNVDSWFDVGTITNVFGVVDFLDAAAGYDQRFYRVRTTMP